MEEGVGGFEAYYLWGKSVEEFGGVVAVVFGQTGNGYFEVQLVLDDLPGYFHLSTATVDNEELGQGFAFLGEAFVAAVDDFGHGGIVVGAFDGFDVELAVFFSIGFASSETNHGGHGEGSLDVGVVEALDVDREFGQLECFLYAFEQVFVAMGDAALVGVDQGSLVSALQLIGFDVAERELEQLQAVAA